MIVLFFGELTYVDGPPEGLIVRYRVSEAEVATFEGETPVVAGLRQAAVEICEHCQYRIKPLPDAFALLPPCRMVKKQSAGNGQG